MMDFFRRALESDMTQPELSPEDDVRMTLLRQQFPQLDGTRASRALEERADGKSGDEAEHTIYARLTDTSVLQKASSMEHHEQWEVKVPKTEDNYGKGSFRVRRTWVDGGEDVYVRATKLNTPVDGKKIETPMPSNRDEFLSFKFLASAGMLKDRYHFPILGTKLVWEVDCYPDGKGGYHEWIKIDLEVEDLDAPLPDFPFPVEDVILPKRFKKLDESEWEARVSKLYEDYFITQNEFVTGEFQRKAAEEAEAQAKTQDAVHTGTEGDGTKPEGGEPQPGQAPAEAPTAPPANPDEEGGGEAQPEAQPNTQEEEQQDDTEAEDA